MAREENENQVGHTSFPDLLRKVAAGVELAVFQEDAYVRAALHERDRALDY